MSAGDDRAPGRPIGPEERTGMLHPANLERYGARWIDPDPRIAHVVDRYWHVQWRLGPGEEIDQRIVTQPAVTLSIEEGAVPAQLVVTGAQSGAWRREIRERGAVFAVRLRPAGLAVLADLAAADLVDGTFAVSAATDPRLYGVLEEIAAADGVDARAATADRVIASALQRHPIGSDGRLANAVLDELLARLRSRAGDSLAIAFGVSERAVQRALHDSIGLGPKRVTRLVRLQEVARRLAAPAGVDLATLAAELGYVDQAHLQHDFREVAGVSPGAYVRSLRELVG
ncbi:helix-turn-helix domain-containing protein [Agromyces sp. SYSU K20354]|uniref:AraC family transcriptional regulator n=1 Tax=Agromyces cavernae TaxID=2898659 RepID=UPI001E4A9C8D|nr:helix-turn-helix domain-containing protein [Agromyces cavernae]MCD2443519.1 helix-turn-helix domain-containing protein [Agromyces cavernae]